MSIYGTQDQMYNNANAVYKVINSNGHKSTYYLYNKIVSTNSKWPGSKKVSKGWYCVVCPERENTIDQTFTYEYPEVNLSEVEDIWFHPELNVRNFQQIKYDPYITDTVHYDDGESDDEYNEGSTTSQSMDSCRW